MVAAAVLTHAPAVPSAAPTAPADAQFHKGDAVYVFYRMGKRCSSNRKYIAVLDPRHGAYRPRMGLSEGWVPARVVEDQDMNPRSRHHEQVCIEYRWPHFFTQRGLLAEPAGFAQEKEPWTEWYPLRYVCRDEEPMTDCIPPGRPGGCSLLRPGRQPELSILAVRWGGVNDIHPCDQWGETGSPASDMFINSFLDLAVVPALGTDYEVWTVYIEDSSDMVKLADAAHLVFGQQHPLHRAKRTCGMFFLYPTAFEENCVPSHETGTDNGAALVDQKSLFRLMKAVERAGIPTRFPHPSGFYELLTSKRWTYIMSNVPHLRIPPTVSVPRMLCRGSCEEAAAFALPALERMRAHQAELRGEPVPEGRITKGVAKLSFSWEALDVKYWEKPRGLETALHQLTQAIEISQELTGQPTDCEAIIVQEYVPHDLELRAYVVEGQVEAVIYTKFCRIKDNLEFGDFVQLNKQSDAAEQWMHGDLAALRDGEEQCRALSKRWMQWADAQCCEPPPGLRFDYFVRRTTAGKAEVWTLEICELGFSMLGDKTLPKKVFTAILRSCCGGSLPSLVRGPALAAAPTAEVDLEAKKRPPQSLADDTNGVEVKRLRT